MAKLRACVLDDEPLAAQLIASYISKTPSMELCGVFNTAQDAIKTLIDSHIDIVFLDIQMPQLTGLELARVIPPQTLIVFTTAYSEHAVDSFKVNTIDYLLKPVSYDDFLSSVNKAIKRIELQNKANSTDTRHDVIIVKSDYKLIQIPLDKILYIEGLKDYVKIFVEDENRCVMTLVSMKHFEKTLETGNFMRIHRSFIINLDKINRIERMHVVIGNTPLPISESYRPAIADYINNHALMPVKTFINDD